MCLRESSSTGLGRVRSSNATGHATPDRWYAAEGECVAGGEHPGDLGVGDGGDVDDLDFADEDGARVVAFAEGSHSAESELFTNSGDGRLLSMVLVAQSSFLLFIKP